MRNFHLILALFFIIITFESCLSAKPKMIVENRSGVKVDSVVLFIFAQRVAVLSQIQSNQIVETKLPNGSLSSKHDLAVGAYAKIGNKKIDIEMWFTDLGANYSEARIVIEPGNHAKINLK